VLQWIQKADATTLSDTDDAVAVAARAVAGAIRAPVLSLQAPMHTSKTVRPALWRCFLARVLCCWESVCLLPLLLLLLLLCLLLLSLFHRCGDCGFRCLWLRPCVHALL
jgi:hypothetical protein